jgi:hypothetical protein
MLNLLLASQTSSQGDLQPVQRRADLSRIITPVVMPFRTTVMTVVAAREFRAVYPERNLSAVRVLRHMGRLIAEHTRIEAFHSHQPREEKETREQLMERIRGVE